MLNKILNILSWILVLAYLGVSLAFTESRLGERTIKSLRIVVADSLQVRFIDAVDVIDQLRRANHRITGIRADSLNRESIRKTVMAMHEIKNAQVFDTPDGVLHIQIWQREPVMRIIGQKTSFYLDADGGKLNLSEKYSARVIMVTGTDDVEFSRQQLFGLAAEIRSQPALGALIMQIHVHDDQNIELVPRIGDFRIFMGDASDAGWKLTKLMAFYEEGLPKVGWDQYESIDLRYSNQIVAKKKNHGQKGDHISH